uniref:Uncharacterized protein n=1 Tax=viral metagenome TaxID=1070528 RepID=A0A6C0ELU9_9ZZZZ
MEVTDAVVFGAGAADAVMVVAGDAVVFGAGAVVAGVAEGVATKVMIGAVVTVAEDIFNVNG